MRYGVKQEGESEWEAKNDQSVKEVGGEEEQRAKGTNIIIQVQEGSV